MLTVYVVLLFAIPSNLTFGELGSLGKPAFLWGLLLLLWWLLTQLQARAIDVKPVWQPVRLIYGVLVVLVLISFAAAMLRGQPADQVSPAFVAVLRVMSWGGALLVAADGVRTHNDAATLIRRLVIAGAAIAGLGLVQFLTGLSLLDWLTQVPGIEVELGGVDSRGEFTRASGTATHPLEFTAALAGILPIAIATAIARGYKSTLATAGSGLRWWVPVALIMVIAILSVSRSAVIGVTVALLVSLPGLPRAYRWVVGGAGLVAAAAVIAVVPGLLGTIVALFTEAGNDPSALSRANALARVPQFVESSPIIGQGFGTFLPRYYIFDNQWVLTVVELGIVGVTLLVLLVAAGVWSANTSRVSPFEDTRTMGRAIVASLVTLTALFLFFDGLSFPISAGLFFLVLGLSASMRTIGTADSRLVAATRRVSRPSVTARPSRTAVPPSS